jgi:catechol 2,3-dioxygenase-like lactoylglutathione lyase family enzyme
MSLKSLDHYTVCVSDLNVSVKFYEEILGLKSGPRPNFGFPGAWIYLGDAPVVHLIAGRESKTSETGSFDHIAFRGTSVEDTIGRLEEQGIAFRRNEIEDFGLTQLFIHDPDGVMVELNFAREA